MREVVPRGLADWPVPPADPTPLSANANVRGGRRLKLRRSYLSSLVARGITSAISGRSFTCKVSASFPNTGTYQYWADWLYIDRVRLPWSDYQSAWLSGLRARAVF